MSDRQRLKELLINADWDDAPERARRGRGKHKRLWLTILMVCIGFGAVANYLDSKQLIRQKSETVRAAISEEARSTSARSATAQPIPRIQPAQRQVDYDDQVSRLLAEPAERPVDAEPRQTVFNDSNYVPVSQVNTISMSQPRAAVPPQPAKPKPSYVTVVKETKTGCWWPEGSLECRRFKKTMKKLHNQSCYLSEHKYTEACRRAALYNPVQ